MVRNLVLFFFIVTISRLGAVIDPKIRYEALDSYRGKEYQDKLTEQDRIKAEQYQQEQKKSQDEYEKANRDLQNATTDVARKDAEKRKLEAEQATAESAENEADLYVQNAETFFSAAPDKQVAKGEVQGVQMTAQRDLNTLGKELKDSFESMTSASQSNSIKDVTDMVQKITEETDFQLNSALNSALVKYVQGFTTKNIDLDVKLAKAVVGDSTTSVLRTLDTYARDAVRIRDALTDRIADGTLSVAEQNFLNGRVADIQKSLDYANKQQSLFRNEKVSFFSQLVTPVIDWFKNTYNSLFTSKVSIGIEAEVEAQAQIALKAESLKGSVQEAQKILADAQMNLDQGNVAIKKVLADQDLQADSLQISLKDARAIRNQLEKFMKNVKYDELVQNYKSLQGEIGRVGDNFTAKLADRVLNRDTYTYLFDQLMSKYTAELSGIEGKPQEVYSALFTDAVIAEAGFDPKILDNPTAITREQIDRADDIARNVLYGPGKLQPDNNVLIGARNAANILQNEASRQTYEAFLKDYSTLQSQGIDPASLIGKTDVAMKKTLTQSLIIDDPQAIDKLSSFLAQKAEIFSPSAQGEVGVETILGQISVAERISSVQDRLNQVITTGENVLKSIKKGEITSRSVPETKSSSIEVGGI